VHEHSAFFQYRTIGDDVPRARMTLRMVDGRVGPVWRDVVDGTVRGSYSAVESDTMSRGGNTDGAGR
jgi:hypothetical protein